MEELYEELSPLESSPMESPPRKSPRSVESSLHSSAQWRALQWKEFLMERAFCIGELERALDGEISTELFRAELSLLESYQ